MSLAPRLSIANLDVASLSKEIVINANYSIIDSAVTRVTGDTMTGALAIQITDSGTATEPTTFTLAHRSSGTPGASFGVTWLVQADNSANALTNQLKLAAGWSSATAGAESSLISWFVRRSGADVEVMRMNSNGNGQLRAVLDFQHAGAAVGFYGKTPVTQPAAYTLTGSVTRTFPTDPSGAYTGIATGVGGTPYAQLTDLNTLRTAVSTLIGVVRQLVSDLGTTTAGVGLNAT